MNQALSIEDTVAALKVLSGSGFSSEDATIALKTAMQKIGRRQDGRGKA